MASSPARFIVYADGSSLSNPGGPGGTGYIVYDRDARQLRFGGRPYVRDGEHPVTNNRMELRAVLEALEPIPSGVSVDVHSDSQYLIKSLSSWVFAWRKRGWLTSQGTPVLNRDLIEAILARQAELTVRYNWVRGHAGHAANEAADALAQAAARGTPMLTTAQVLAALQKVGLAPGLSPRR